MFPLEGVLLVLLGAILRPNKVPWKPLIKELSKEKRNAYWLEGRLLLFFLRESNFLSFLTDFLESLSD